MAIQVRNSVLAAKVESVEGTPVSPTAAGDYVPLQDDFTMEPAFEVLENVELKASIGRSKPILGLENPTASFSHYLKHSGVEGQAPQFDEILTAGFGAEVIASTEYNTVAASTTLVVKVDSGEGVNFQRGQALLVKDATNGYSIRPVLSVSGDDLTLGFALANAPALGVNLGKAVLYKPANTGHQSLTLWHYAGNDGAVQMMAGGRLTEYGLSFQAGQLINQSFSFEGLSYYFNPIEITATSKYIDFTDDTGTFAAVLTEKFYKDPHDLASAIQTAMDGLTAETITCTYSDSTGKFTIATSTSTIFSLLWNSGVNAANTIAAKIGFSAAANDTGATSYIADNALSFAAPQTPSYDNSDPLAAKSNSLLIGDATDNTCFAANTVNFTMTLEKSNIDSICSDSGRSGSLINGREVTITVNAILEKYDADKFRRFREGDQTAFMYAFGTKSGGNWVAGKCGCLYVPTATIVSHSIVDNNGVFDIALELNAYVDNDGNGEVYLSFL